MAGIVSAVVAAVGLAYGVYAGETQKAAGIQARRRSQKAQDEALRLQMIEKQRSAQVDSKSNRPLPGNSVLTDALGTTSDNTGGLDDKLKLARPTKLGGGTL